MRRKRILGWRLVDRVWRVFQIRLILVMPYRPTAIIGLFSTKRQALSFRCQFRFICAVRVLVCPKKRTFLENLQIVLRCSIKKFFFKSTKKPKKTPPPPPPTTTKTFAYNLLCVLTALYNFSLFHKGLVPGCVRACGLALSPPEWGLTSRWSRRVFGVKMFLDLLCEHGI